MSHFAYLFVFVSLGDPGSSANLFESLGGVGSSGGDGMSSGDPVVSGIESLTVEGGSQQVGSGASGGGVQASDPDVAQGDGLAQGSSSRVPHTRPAVGMETSVLFNEWEKGWFYLVPL